MKNKDLLDKYIARLLAIKEQKRDELSNSELREIALEVGLTDSDLLEAKQEVQNYLARGQTYTQLKQWEKAQKEFEEASELDPLNIKTSFELANFYFIKWKKTKSKKHLKLAQKEVNKCLLLSPKHQKTVELFKQIVNSKRKKKAFTKVKVFFFLFLLLPAIAGATLFILNEIGYFSAPRTGLEGKTYPIDIDAIEFIPNPQSEGLEFNVKHLRIIHPDYPSSDFNYDLVGNIKSSKFEIRRFALRAEFLSENNKILADELFWFFDVANPNNSFDDSFILQANDKYPFSFLSKRDRSHIYFNKSKAQKIAKVRFVIHHLERYAAAAQYPDYKLIQVDWAVAKSEGIDLEIRERKNSTYRTQNNESTINKLILEVKNTGQKPIKELFITVNWLDTKNEVLYKHEFQTIGIYQYLRQI